MSWTAPTVTSGTLASYKVYILLYNTARQIVEEVLFTTLTRHALKTARNSTAYTVSPPKTNVIFPYATWTLPNGYQYSSNNCYSFHVYSTIIENPTLKSKVTGVDAFFPHVVGTNTVGHINPRFQIDSMGAVNLFFQDTYEDVASSVEMILNTPLGWRTALPQFGIEDPTFQQNAVNTWLAAINRWEPRADATINVAQDPNSPNAPDAITVNITINPVNQR